MSNKSLALVGLLAAFFASASCYGQKEEKIDNKASYKKFRTRPSSQSNSSTLLQEADTIKATHPEKALGKVEEALGISLAQDDVFHEGKSYELLGEINENIEEWALALENYKRAYEKLATKFAASSEFRRTLHGLGHTNLKLQHFEESLRYFQEALTFPLSQADRMDRWLDISEVYYQMGRYDESIKSLDNLPAPGRQLNPSLDNRLLNQLAKIYARKNDLGKTKELYSNSINSIAKNDTLDREQEESLQNAKEEIADVLRGQKRYDDEIDLRQQAITRNLKSNNFAEVTRDKVEIGKTLAAKGDDRAALKALEEATAMADTINGPQEKASALLALAELYEKNGRKDQALKTYKKYSHAVDQNNRAMEAKQTEKSGLLNIQKGIDALTSNVSLGQREVTIEQGTVFRQQLIIYGLMLIILIIAVTSYFIYKNAQASKVANQLLALKSLRSQMNPHFIFNALNSVNHFIAQQDERTANRFLSEFSQLMRLVLENSQEDFIPLEREQEILSLYLKLEHYRFRDKFSYTVHTDDDFTTEGIEVPPMLIQPYLENAVWHGLRYKETKGNLSLSFHREPDNLVVEISDDGIGRARSAELKTENQKKHHSTGLKNIQQRLTIINKVYRANYRVLVEDLDQSTGTRVRIYLPIHRKNGIR